jgi:hypothetical protein
MTPEQELDLRMAEPEPGEVIKMAVAYPENPLTYVYAAICFEGMWYLSGVQSTARRSWDDLISFLKSKNAEVVSLQRATSWEDTL